MLTSNMSSNQNRYQKMIEQATSKQVLLPKNYKHKMNPLYSSDYDQMLPSDYPFKSSQQIERNIVLDQIRDSLTDSDNILNESLQSCFGLVLCQHEQDGNIMYVYGTGILIHNNIVLTNAQNVFCRRLNKLYTNIRFVTGLNNNRYYESYDIKNIHYPQQYAMGDMDCCYYDFAILQLNDDLSDRCGYVGCKIGYDVNNRSITSYRYERNNRQGSFTLKQISQNNEFSLMLMKKFTNGYYVVGIQSGSKMIAINQDVKNLINKWTTVTRINLQRNSINEEGCIYLKQSNVRQLTSINLCGNNIGAIGCKYLSEAGWDNLLTINLYNNNIGNEGCKYLSQANWIYLVSVNLKYNNIDAEGCKYLKQANWKHLTTINLWYNNICSEGCRYLRQADWKRLIMINLYNNKINRQGCKYLRDADWNELMAINLGVNNIIDYEIERTLFTTRKWAALNL